MENATRNPSTPLEPELAPPGAGIPWWIRWAGKYVLVPFRSRSTSWKDSGENFTRECERILKLCDGLTPEQLSQRVLVPRMAGLEDSSRYWSIAMTLEHLLIVSIGMAQVIGELSQGRVPDRIADTAAVKPQKDTSEAYAQRVLTEFRALARDHLSTLNRSVGDRRSSLLFTHPWFGGLTAHQWYWLMGVHVGLHRQQVRLIRSKIQI